VRIEWARLSDQQSTPAPNNEIVLEGTTPCRVLLLHGLTGTPAEFGYVAQFLHNRGGLSVECRQLVNHGQPLGVLARTHWEEIYASARGHFLSASDAARRQNVPLIVGGLSLGAVLSLLLAAEFPHNAAGVICLSPTLFYDGWNVPWTQRLIRLADYLPVKHFMFLREVPPYGLKDEILRRRVAASYANMSPRDSAEAGRLGYAHFPLQLFCEMRHLILRCIESLPKVTAPLLLLQAEHDDATSPRNAQFIYDRVASTRKELVLLKNSYHVIVADLDREVVATAMTNFCVAIARRFRGDAAGAFDVADV
jgi:carboxylesterase